MFLGAGVVPRGSRGDNHNVLGTDLSKYLLVEPGDLVFNKLRTWQGGFGASSHRGIVSPAYFVLRPGVLADAQFLHYLLLSGPYLAELRRRSKWMPPSQFDIPWEALKSLPVALPTVQVQSRIAAFLAEQLQRMDEVLRAAQAQVELVEEWRADVQNQFCVPSSDEADVRLGRAIRSIEQGWSPQCEAVEAAPEEWGVLKVGAVKRGHFIASENKRLPDDLSPEVRFEVQAGDLLFSRANTPALVGDAAVVPLDVRPRLILCDKLMRIHLVSGTFLAEFVMHSARTSVARAHFTAASSGASASMVNIRGEDLRGLRLRALSLAAQAGVVEELNRNSEAAARLTQELSELTRLLEARKRSLITACVSGEFDVASASGRAGDAALQGVAT